MELVFHGGKCCGIKTIYGFFNAPWDMTSRRESCEERNQDKYGHSVRSDLSFFTDEAPKETYKERLVRFIDFCKRRRPRHMIEVVLSNQSFSVYNNETHEFESIRQIDLWGPILEELGFLPVTTFNNSNTGFNVTVYHLVYK